MLSISNDYKADVTSGKIPLLVAWLKQYDWLKVNLCTFCVFFQPSFDKGGVHGAFI